MSHQVLFPGTHHPACDLPDGGKLSEQLTILNSPLLFGCRTGICGTCLIQVEAGFETLSPADEEEREALAVYAPGNAKARLACRILLNCGIALKKIESA